MDNFDNLTEDNFLLYAIKSYESPHCIMSEFEEDLKRIKYLKKLFRKYKTCRVLKERLILNHIIGLSNVFSVPSTTRMLFFKIDKADHDVLKTFLLYLDYLPDKIVGINGKTILSSDIKVCLDIAKILREL